MTFHKTLIGLLAAGSGVVAPVLPAYALAAETTAIATAMTSAGQAPNAQRKYTVDRWIKKMKAQGVWAKLSRFYVVGDTSGQSLVNWVSPGTGDLTIGGVPVFSAPAAAFAGAADNGNGGFKASATSMNLDTGVTLNQLYAAGTFAFGVYQGTTANLAIEMGAYDGTAGATIYAGNATNLPGTRMLSTNQNPGVLGQVDGTGFSAACRTSATSSNFYSQGRLMGTSAADNIIAPVNGTRTMRFLTANTAAGSNTSKAWQGGFIALQALTDADMDMLYRALRSIIESVQYGDVLLNEAGYAPQAVSAQVVVYGWTLQSINFAFEAARQGKTVALVGGWRDVSLGALGGVSANGLNRTDLNSIAAIGGLPRLFLKRTNGLSAIADTQANTSPAAVNLICRQMLDAARAGGLNIAVYATGGISSATKSGARITSITTLDGRTFTGAYFHDGTYEGDVLPAAGVSFITGREAAGTGVEASNGYRGVVSTNRPCKNPGGSPTYYDIDPFITPGVQGSGTIAGVNATYTAETVGQADNLSQAFNFRLTFTTVKTRGIALPSTAPSGYSSSNYELWGRLAAAMVAGSTTYAITDGLLAVTTVNSLTDINNIGVTSTDLQNHAADYVFAGDYTTRETAWQLHMAHVKGLIYYYTNDADSRISGQPIRTSLAAYYLPVDCYLDPHPNDVPYWPGQMYVREMRRMVGSLVWTGNDLTATDGTAPRSVKTVGVSNYNIDSHSIQRFAENTTGTWRVNGEGTFGQTSGGTDGISPIPYEVCVPQSSECTNLSVSFCFSATHVAFGAMRMEFTSAGVAQSMAVATALAIEGGNIDLQSVDYPTLRTRLLATPSYSGEVAPVLPQTN